MENFWKWLAGIVVVSILFLFAGFMIGSAVYDSKKQGVDLSIECLKHGGNPVTNTSNGSFECRK